MDGTLVGGTLMGSALIGDTLANHTGGQCAGGAEWLEGYYTVEERLMHLMAVERLLATRLLTLLIMGCMCSSTHGILT